MFAPVQDEQLLEAWRSGDETAGQRLLKRHFRPLYRFFANKAGDACDDLIQTTMMSIVRAKDQFRADSSFRTYLFVVARNTLHRHLRSQQRDRLVLDPEQDSIWALTRSPSTMAAQGQQQRILLDGLRRIPVDLQIALELHYWEDLSTAELAEILGLPQGTVKSRLRRAREQLVAQVEALTDDPDHRRRTNDNLDRWAAEIRNAAGFGD
jgi:RNA polymerase sigma factor (sigma-70 family)